MPKELKDRKRKHSGHSLPFVPKDDQEIVKYVAKSKHDGLHIVKGYTDLEFLVSEGRRFRQSEELAEGMCVVLNPSVEQYYFETSKKVLLVSGSIFGILSHLSVQRLIANGVWPVSLRKLEGHPLRVRRNELFRFFRRPEDDKTESEEEPTGSNDTNHGGKFVRMSYGMSLHMKRLGIPVPGLPCSTLSKHDVKEDNLNILGQPENEKNVVVEEENQNDKNSNFEMVEIMENQLEDDRQEDVEGSEISEGNTSKVVDEIESQDEENISKSNQNQDEIEQSKESSEDEDNAYEEESETPENGDDAENSAGESDENVEEVDQSGEDSEDNVEKDEETAEDSTENIEEEQSGDESDENIEDDENGENEEEEDSEDSTEASESEEESDRDVNENPESSIVSDAETEEIEIFEEGEEEEREEDDQVGVKFDDNDESKASEEIDTENSHETLYEEDVDEELVQNESEDENSLNGEEFEEEEDEDESDGRDVSGSGEEEETEEEMEESGSYTEVVGTEDTDIGEHGEMTYEQEQQNDNTGLDEPNTNDEHSSQLIENIVEEENVDEESTTTESDPEDQIQEPGTSVVTTNTIRVVDHHIGRGIRVQLSPDQFLSQQSTSSTSLDTEDIDDFHTKRYSHEDSMVNLSCSKPSSMIVYEESFKNVIGSNPTSSSRDAFKTDEEETGKGDESDSTSISSLSEPEDEATLVEVFKRDQQDV